MDLLALESSMKFMVTGAVLLVAVVIDAIARQPEAGGGTGLTPLRVGLIGYGLAGSAFHAPLVEAVPGLELASIVTSTPSARSRRGPRTRRPRCCPSADALFAAADAHDLVVVAAPNREHVPLGLAAVDAGLHLVVDKPLAPRAWPTPSGSPRPRRRAACGERLPQPPLGRRLPDAAPARLRGLAGRAAAARVALRALASRGGRGQVARGRRRPRTRAACCSTWART